VSRIWIALAGAVALACGGGADERLVDAAAGGFDGAPAGDGAPADDGAPAGDGAGVDADPDCGEVGEGCSGSCRDEALTCHEGGTGSFCAPTREGCAGFSGARCRDPDHLCVNPSGSSGGVCLTAAERDCVCLRSPDAIEGC
jgi:hypothetical protein